jgi:hypothetical protein
MSKQLLFWRRGVVAVKNQGAGPVYERRRVFADRHIFAIDGYVGTARASRCDAGARAPLFSIVTLAG